MKKKGKNKTDYTGLAARLYKEKYNNPNSKLAYLINKALLSHQHKSL